jgi:ArsR family transcriptional regulator
MRVLTSAGLVKAKRIKGWTMYKRDKEHIRAIRRLIGTAL